MTRLGQVASSTTASLTAPRRRVDPRADRRGTAPTTSPRSRSELLTGPRAAAVVGPYGDADELPDEVRDDGGVTITVGVLGAAGRMGSEACAAVEGADDLELVARVDVRRRPRRPLAAPTSSSTSRTPSPSWTTCACCVDAGMHVVVGTSGVRRGAASTTSAAGCSPEQGVLVARTSASARC